MVRHRDPAFVSVSDRAREHDMMLQLEPIPHVATALFILCNPSVADAMLPDPTSDKCIAFGRAWGADYVEL